jgi:hypothetical protein
MRLLTGIILPEEEALNKRMIGRGERLKARIEEGETPPWRWRVLEPSREVVDLWMAEAYGHQVALKLDKPHFPIESIVRDATIAAHHARRVPRETVGGPEGEAGPRDH